MKSKHTIIAQGAILNHSGNWMETLWSNGKVTRREMTSQEVEEYIKQHKHYARSIKSRYSNTRSRRRIRA